MFNVICKSFPHMKHSLKTSPTHKFDILQFNLLSTTPTKKSSKPISENENQHSNQHSFTVNFLIITCGLAPERAVTASKYVNFDKADKPEAVISLLMNKGFTNTQIEKLVNSFPAVILSDPQKTLLPKIEFFESKGFTKTQLPVILLVAPKILRRSLEKYIIPTFSALSDFLGCDKNALIAINRHSRILVALHSHVTPNIEILQNAGVPDARIAYFLKDRPFLFTKRSDTFKGSVDETKKVGFDPISSTFIVGVSVLASLSRPSWREKIELYKRFGCSEDEVLMAFKRCPWCMMASKAKIERLMGIFINEIGWDSSKVMKISYIFTYSLDKRIIPRSSVYQVLLSEGLIAEEKASLIRMIRISKESFLKKFVRRYEKEAPELLKLYRERLETSIS